MKTLTGLAAAALSLALLAGCGTQGAPTSATRIAQGAEADSYTGLKKAFTRIHKAMFTSMDADKNGWLDEYEVSKHMTLREFNKADTAQGWGSAGRLSRTEFVEYATHTFLWFNDNADNFANRFRKDLGKVFNRLDENGDYLLAKSELSNADVAKLKLTFEYERLNVKMPIKKVPAEALAKADKTGDGSLSQAEFEDLYIEMVIEALGGDGSAPAPQPQPQPAPAQG